MNLLSRFNDLCKKHIKTTGIGILVILSFYFLFFHLGYYKLIDVDETRYVGISYAMFNNGDWTVPMLNGVPFLEKPPLYFWLNVISFKLFGFSEFTSRLMTAILGLFAVCFNFFFGKKVLDVHFGVISSLILASSLWFLLFTHVAILDFGFMFFTMSAIYSVLLTLFNVQEKNKKYLWWLGYIFMALAVLMKGFIGIIVPSMVVFFAFLASGKVKELFKPINIFPGLVLLFVIATPWHYFVYQAQGQEWVNMYIIKHHFARFIDSGLGLGRKQPFWFYIPVILCGFLPWTFSFISSLLSGIKVACREIASTKRIRPIFSSDTDDRKVILFSTIYFVCVFLFFSSSSTKLPSYILTLIPAISLMCAYYWWGYLEYNKYKKGIVASSLCFASVLLVAVFGAIILFKAFPNVVGIKIVEQTKPFFNYAAIWIFLTAILLIISVVKNKKNLLFLSHCIFMAGIIYFATTFIIPFTMTFGQNELESYALYAKEYDNSKLVTFDFPAKYSVMNKFGKNIYFIYDADFDGLDEIVKDKKESVFVIVKNKKFKDYKDKFKNWEVVKGGDKYTLLIKQ